MEISKHYKFQESFLSLLLLNIYQTSQGIVIMVESNQNFFTPGRHNAYQFGYFY